MMKFKCKDIGIDCELVIDAKNEKEFIDLAVRHAVNDHREILVKYTRKQTNEMIAKIQTLAQESVSRAQTEVPQ
jgi:predicted small metal-binding protein